MVNGWYDDWEGDKVPSSILRVPFSGIFCACPRPTLAIALPYVWLISISTRTVRSGLRHQIDRKERRDLSIFQIGLRFIERCFTNDRLIRLPLCTSSEETVRWLAENRCLYFISRRGNLAGMNFTVQATAQLIHRDIQIIFGL